MKNQKLIYFVEEKTSSGIVRYYVWYLYPHAPIQTLLGSQLARKENLMKWTREAMEALADKFAQVFVEAVEKSGGKASIVKDESCPTLHEADAPLPCAICGEPNEIGDICEDCARIHAPVDDDDSNIPLASGHGYGY